MKTMTHGEIVDVLRGAEDTIETKRYDYYKWKHCACGHIFRAAKGRGALRNIAVVYPKSGSRYEQVVVAAASALYPEHEYMFRDCSATAVTRISMLAAGCNKEGAIGVLIDAMTKPEETVPVVEQRELVWTC